MIWDEKRSIYIHSESWWLPSRCNKMVVCVMVLLVVVMLAHVLRMWHIDTHLNLPINPRANGNEFEIVARHEINQMKKIVVVRACLVCVCIWANMWVYILCLCIGITNRKHNGTWFTLNKNKTKINGTRVRIVPPTNFADWSTIYIVQLLQLSCNVGTTFSLTMLLERFFHCKLQALIRQYSLFLSMIIIAAIAVASKITFRYL